MTVVASGYNIVVRPSMAQSLGRVYVANDFDPMKVIDTETVTATRNVGITAPSSAFSAPSVSAGNVDIGTHLVRYRYEDTTRNRLSNPSDAIAVTVSSTTATLTVTLITSADSTVNAITIEMTGVGGTQYYRVASVANSAGTYAISISDANLINKTPSSLYGDFGHGAPPLASIVGEHRQRLFCWGGTSRTFTVGVTNGSASVTGTGFSAAWAGQKVTMPDGSTSYISSSTTTTITLTAVYGGTTNASATVTVANATPDLLSWSRSGYPESWDTVNFSRRITLATGDSPVAMISLFDDLYLIGQRSMRRLIYSSDPSSNARVIPIPNSMGAFHPRCVWSDAGNIAFGWGRDGIWIIDSMQPRRISDAISTTIANLADATQTAARFVVFEPIERTLLCFFPLSGETSCRAAAAYHIDSDEWEIWYYRQGMTAGCLNSAYKDRARLMLCDINGGSWRVGVAKNDGGDYGVTTAGASCTTTVLQGVSAVLGQMIYRPATQESKLVTAVGTGNITVNAFATAPTLGEALWVGSIRQRIITEWYQSHGVDSKQRPGWFLLAVQPTAFMGTLQVYYYLDFSTTPTPLTVLSTDIENTGVSIGTNYIQVDMDVGAQDGFVALPIVGDWSRSIRAEVIAQTPYDGLKFQGFQFSTRPTWDVETVEAE